MTVATAHRTPADRNADATVHVGQLDEKVTDALLWELMVQAGPVRHVYIPRNRITGAHFGYGFCEFYTSLDAFYATKVLNMVALFSKSIRVSQSSVDRTSQDVGAHLFIGNLVEEVDEKLLHDAFSSFGPLIEAPYIMAPAANSKARRYGFIKYSRFEHSDAAIAAMNGQYICNQPITVQYAFKKDSDSRERHGSNAERLLAARALQSSLNTTDQLHPNTLFSDRPARPPSRQLAQPPPPARPPLAPPTLPYMAAHPHPVAAFSARNAVAAHAPHVAAGHHRTRGAAPVAGGPMGLGAGRASGHAWGAAYAGVPFGVLPTMPAALPPGVAPVIQVPSWQQSGVPPHGAYRPIAQHAYDRHWPHGRRLHGPGPQHVREQRGAPTPVVDEDAPPPPGNWLDVEDHSGSVCVTEFDGRCHCTYCMRKFAQGPRSGPSGPCFGTACQAKPLNYTCTYRGRSVTYRPIGYLD